MRTVERERERERESVSENVFPLLIKSYELQSELYGIEPFLSSSG